MFARRHLSASLCLRRVSLPSHQPRPGACPPCVSCSRFSTKPDESSDEPTDAFLPELVRNRRGRKAKPQLSTRPLGKIHGRKGRKLRETSAPLKIDTLGTPSEILVLRDAGFSDQEAREIKETTAEIQHFRGLSKGEILDIIQKEKDPPTKDEVFEAIESLKPPPLPNTDGKAYLSKEKARQLFGKLYNGFSLGQLAAYDKHFHLAAADHPKLRQARWDVRTNKKLGISVTPWTPGLRPIHERLVSSPFSDPRPGQGDRQPGKGIDLAMPESDFPSKSKVKHIRRIMLNAWNIQINEVVDSKGQLEISLPQWAILLLQAGGSRNSLDSLRGLRTSKIDVWWPHKIIRISADKQTAERTAEDIMSQIRQSVDFTFDLNPFKSILPQKVDFDARKNLDLLLKHDEVHFASKLSRTVIEATSASELTIRALNSKDIELAQRILIAMIDIPIGRKSHVLANTTDLTDAIIHPASLPNTLSWREKRKMLGRWTLPVKRTSIGQDPQGKEVHSALELGSATSSPGEASNQSFKAPAMHATSRDKLRDLLISPLFTPQVLPWKDTKARSSDNFWHQEPKTEVFALFGQVLHPVTRHIDPSRLLHELKYNNRERRVFSSTIPGLAQTLSHLSDVKNTSSQTISLSLIPSPWSKQGFLGLPEYPEITLRWHVDPATKKPQLHNMVAGIGSRVADYLLPDHAIDIRFVKRERNFAMTEVMLTRLPHVRQFIKSIESSIQSGGLLSAPAKVEVPIPKWFISQHSKSPDQIIREWSSGEMDVMEYIPQYFEHRQFTSVGFESHSLAYQGVEAGVMGGRRGELRLRMNGGSPTMKWENHKPTPVRGTSTSEANLARNVEDFITSSFNVASLIQQSTQEEFPTVYVPQTRFTKWPTFREPFTWEWNQEVTETLDPNQAQTAQWKQPPDDTDLTLAAEVFNDYMTARPHDNVSGDLGKEVDPTDITIGNEIMSTGLKEQELGHPFEAFESLDIKQPSIHDLETETLL